MDKVYEELLSVLKYGDTMVVGISGGPDSMALLHLLIGLKKALDIEIIACHVDHNTGRPGQAEEQIFVKEYCLKHNVLFEGMVIKEHGDDNFHNEARVIRYNFFTDVIKKYNAKYLFTAHHGDDLMETILMRIVRGSTLKGYSGFSKYVDMGKYKIIRPLINVTKDEIVMYNKKHRLKYATDSSNSKDVYTRNRFRKYVLPFLKKEDRNVHHKFYKFSNILLEYNEYIDSVVNKVLNEVYPQNILNIPKFLELEHVIQMKIICYILEHTYQDDLMLITDHHTDMLFELVHSKKANAKIYLPNNIKAIKAYDTLFLDCSVSTSQHYEIEIDNYVNLPNGRNIEVVDNAVDKSNFTCRLDSNEIKLPLHVRTRQVGDKMQILGMLGRKKINDIFIDSKISMQERELWPVVIDSNGDIVWLPGLKKSKFDKTKSEKYDIILRYY